MRASHNAARLSVLAGLALAVSSAGLVRQSPPLLPDPKLTPGDTLNVSKRDICTPGYTKKVRDVPKAVKDQVYAEYGIRRRAPGEFEVDHLISLELGGSNSIKNLWPQSYKTQPWNAHVKDALENELHRLVCSNRLDLRTAQRDIATDWIAAYKKYFHANLPIAKGGRSRGRARPVTRPASHPGRRTGLAPNPAAGSGRVWVNTKSRKYFLAGSKYYGKTKQGEYMTEAEARKRGYTAARGD